MILNYILKSKEYIRLAIEAHPPPYSLAETLALEEHWHSLGHP